MWFDNLSVLVCSSLGKWVLIYVIEQLLFSNSRAKNLSNLFYFKMNIFCIFKIFTYILYKIYFTYNFDIELGFGQSWMNSASVYINLNSFCGSRIILWSPKFTWHHNNLKIFHWAIITNNQIAFYSLCLIHKLQKSIKFVCLIIFSVTNFLFWKRLL